MAAAQGIKQFLHIWEKNKSSRDDVLKWGDEVEYTLIVKDEEDGFYRLQCAAPKKIEAREPAARESAPPDRKMKRRKKDSMGNKLGKPCPDYLNSS